MICTSCESLRMQDTLWAYLLRRDFKAPSGVSDGRNTGTLRGMLQTVSGSLRTRTLNTFGGTARTQASYGTVGTVGAATELSIVRYKRLLMEYHTKLKAEKTAAIIRQKETAVGVQSRYLRLFFDVLQFGCGIGCLGCYSFITLLLLLLKLNGSDSIPWAAVFLPFLGTVIQPFCCAAIGAVVERLSLTATPLSVWRPQTTGDTYNLVAYAAKLKACVLYE
jgi:hypothetical protein